MTKNPYRNYTHQHRLKRSSMFFCCGFYKQVPNSFDRLIQSITRIMDGTKHQVQNFYD